MPSAAITGTILGRPRVFALDDLQLCRIGRGSKSDIVLAEDAKVSRTHAVIQRVGSGEFYLTDLGSRNGTLVNGRPINAPVRLNNGDAIRVGSHEFQFLMEDLPGALPLARTAEDETSMLFTSQLITVLVIDIRGYTPLARELGEARMSEIIGAFSDAAGAILTRDGSWTQQYIGDAVMAIWVHSAPSPSAGELRSVFHSLLDITGAVAGLHNRFALPRPMHAGAGINTGIAALGKMGSSGWGDYTALGDTVNKAFRFETASKTLGCDVVLGEDSYNALAVIPAVAPLFRPASIQLKGYAEPAPVYSAALDALRSAFPGV